jgi:hypothetical protein
MLVKRTRLSVITVLPIFFITQARAHWPLAVPFSHSAVQSALLDQLFGLPTSSYTRLAPSVVAVTSNYHRKRRSCYFDPLILGARIWDGMCHYVYALSILKALLQSGRFLAVITCPWNSRLGRLTHEEFQPVSCIESSLSVHYKNAVRPTCYMSRRPSLHTRLLQFVRIRICGLFPVFVHAGLQHWSLAPGSACVSARLDVLEGNPTAVITLTL